MHKSPSQSEPFNKWLIFSLVAVGIFMSTLDGSIVNVALPTIMAELGVPLTTVKWVVVIYLLTISSLLLSFGRLSDMRGRRWVYSRGLAVFSLGSLLCGLSPGALWLIASRALQGVGAAMIMACTPALVVDVFPAAERGRALGMVGTVVAAGLTMGPALGGMLLQFFPWRVIFYINVPVGIAAVLATLRVLKRGSETTSQETFDWPGSILLAVCFTALLIVLSRSNEWGYTSPQTLALTGVFVVSAIFLIRQETRTRLSHRGARAFFDPAFLRQYRGCRNPFHQPVYDHFHDALLSGQSGRISRGQNRRRARHPIFLSFHRRPLCRRHERQNRITPFVHARHVHPGLFPALICLDARKHGHLARCLAAGACRHGHCHIHLAQQRGGHERRCPEAQRDRRGLSGHRPQLRHGFRCRNGGRDL